MEDTFSLPLSHKCLPFGFVTNPQATRLPVPISPSSSLLGASGVPPVLQEVLQELSGSCGQFLQVNEKNPKHTGKGGSPFLESG